jgi:ABC-type oligopeptide transport system substrate-binding subunit
VRLTQPAGYWLSELLMPSYWVVDQKVIVSNGVDKWWTTPEGLIGTAPSK